MERYEIYTVPAQRSPKALCPLRTSATGIEQSLSTIDTDFDVMPTPFGTGGSPIRWPMALLIQ